MQVLFRSMLLIVVILSALLVPGVTAAQEPPPDCTPALLAERFAEIGDQITHAEALLTDNDTTGALEAFSAAAALVDDVRATCGTSTAASAVDPEQLTPPASALCNDYPQYCVPFIGGPMVNDIPNEAPGLRSISPEPPNTAVVRGLTAEGGLFIGNPDAPIHFLEYLDFACPHCANYEDEAIIPLIQQAVTTGQATYEVRTMAFVAGQLSTDAAYAMFCAGEQGAAWEMHDALFKHYNVDHTQAYTMDGLKQIGDELGLDTDALASCIASGRYADRQASFNASFNALGLTGTPSMLSRRSEADDWVLLDDRSLDNVLSLVATANQ